MGIDGSGHIPAGGISTPERRLLAQIQPFTVDGRPLLIGVLARYNKKTDTVITNGGECWNFAPGLLHRVLESDNENAQNPNVIPTRKG